MTLLKLLCMLGHSPPSLFPCSSSYDRSLDLLGRGRDRFLKKGSHSILVLLLLLLGLRAPHQVVRPRRQVPRALGRARGKGLTCRLEAREPSRAPAMRWKAKRPAGMEEAGRGGEGGEEGRRRRRGRRRGEGEEKGRREDEGGRGGRRTRERTREERCGKCR